MKKLKVAVAGIAHVHAPGFVEMFRKYPEEAEVIGFADVPDPSGHPEESLEARIARNMHLADLPECFASVDEMLDQKPDIVCIGSDIADHPMLAQKCLARGIYTVIEKPLAASGDDAAVIAAAAEKCPDHLFVNWPVAWFPTYRKGQELARAGAVGRILRMVYRTPSTRGPYGNKPVTESAREGAWCFRHDRGGGSIIDYAGYGCFLAAWFLGAAPQSVFGIKKNFLIPFSDTEDYAELILDYGDKIAVAEGSWSTFSSGEIPTGPVVYGENGTIVCDRFAPEVKVYRRYKAYVPCEPPDELYRPQPLTGRDDLAGHLIDFIRHGIPVPETMTFELNRMAQLALSAGILSCRTGKVETVPTTIHA